MLIPRILTAVVLLAILLCLVIAKDAIYFVVFVSLAASLTLFEWLRIALGGKQVVAALTGFLLFAGSVAAYSFAVNGNDNAFGIFTHAALSQSHPSSSLLFSAIVACTFFVGFVWLFIVPIVLYRADTNGLHDGLFHSAFAVLSTLTTWFTIVICYVLFGAWFLFSFLMVVWCADVFAYFGGKYFGGKKLAPAISPGKTQSGAIVGILSVVVWMLISAHIEHSFASVLLARIGIFWLIGVAILMALVSICGDLYESLLKRRAHVKDSSALLPGHGGVWDRLDSVVAVSPLAMIFIFLLYI